MHRILISEKVSDETIKYLKSNDIEVKNGRGIDHKTICEDIFDCDAVMVRVMRVDLDVIRNAPKLKVIAKHGVGCDSIDTVAAARHGIPVVFAPGSNSLSVAEHTIALMLSCAHCIRQANMSYSKGEYSKKDLFPITEVSGKTIGLIGCGNVAQHVARIAKYGFNMRVLGYDPYTTSVLPDIEMTDSLEYLLSKADYVSLHIPANMENRNFIDKRQLELMKESSYLINTARGEVVNMAALIEAIDLGNIAGIGLDVTWPEPVPPDSELFKRKNVLLTPHIGAASMEAMDRMGLMAAEGVVDVLNGRQPKYLYRDELL